MIDPTPLPACHASHPMVQAPADIEPQMALSANPLILKALGVFAPIPFTAPEVPGCPALPKLPQRKAINHDGDC